MNKEPNPFKTKILVAPLDWGLGHATRCIPIIKELLKQNVEVIVAGEGKIKTLLSHEFPQLHFVELKGYNIEYGKNKWDLLGKIVLQIPKLLQTIEDENEWLETIIEKYKIDAVISDNRYGLYNEKIFSVFITHQLLIKTSVHKTADNLLQQLNYQYINEFNECWVPDIENGDGLAGDLSHPEKKPQIPIHYVGALSRFSSSRKIIEEKNLLIIISGPEPQRSILENEILEQLKKYTEPVLLIRGLPGDSSTIEVSENVKVVNHLPADELQQQIESAYMVISRCGYSTVMDLMSLQKRSILIPTPGQTEQEYLAEHLMRNSLAFCVQQSKFKLLNVLELAESFNYNFKNFNNNSLLQNAVNNLLEQLSVDEEK